MKIAYAIILFFVSLNLLAADVPADYLKCEKDTECSITTSNGCNCSSGGDQVAISTKYKKKWEGKFSDISCIQVISDDPSCTQKVVCEKTKCTLK